MVRIIDVNGSQVNPKADLEILADRGQIQGVPPESCECIDWFAFGITFTLSIR